MVTTLIRIFVYKFLSTLFLILIFGIYLEAEEPSSRYGTVIVTYQTDSRGDRLDRIRFLIRDAQFKQQMYPKEMGYIDDIAGLSRMVITEDLTPGDYTLEFVVPNHDNFFEETPLRQFSIASNKVVKIDQMIKARHAVTSITPHFFLPLEIKKFQSNKMSEISYLLSFQAPSFRSKALLQIYH